MQDFIFQVNLFFGQVPLDHHSLSATLAMALRFDERTRDVFSEFCRIILNYENYTGAGRSSVPKGSGASRGPNRGQRKSGTSAGKGFAKKRSSTGEVGNWKLALLLFSSILPVIPASFIKCFVENSTRQRSLSPLPLATRLVGCYISCHAARHRV